MSDDADDRLALAAWTAPPVPAELADRVLAAVHGSTAIDPEPPAAPRWRRFALIAGTLIAAAAAATFALWPQAARDHRGQLTASAPSLVDLDGEVEAMVETGGQLSWQSAHGGLVVHHDAGIVTYRHRGDERLEVVTPAGSLTSERASFRVEAPMKRDLVVGGSSAVVAAMVVVAVYQGRVQAREPARAPVTIEAGQQLALGSGATPTTPARPVVVAKAAIDRARRAALVQAIAAARQTPRPGGAAVAPSVGPAPAVVGSATAPGATPATLTKDQIRGGVKEVVPMLMDCYELTAETGPLISTVVHTKLTIDSEPDLGTVVAVNQIEITGPLGQSTDFRDCLTATLESMVLPPIADGGHIAVDYPFVFAPKDDLVDAATAAAASTAAPPAPAPASGSNRRAAPKPASPSAGHPPASDKIDLPAPIPPAASALDLANDAGAAAMAGQWTRALSLAEESLAATDSSSLTRTKAITVAALAACNLRDAKKARAFYLKASASAKSMLAQRCLANGVDVSR